MSSIILYLAIHHLILLCDYYYTYVCIIYVVEIHMTSHFEILNKQLVKICDWI